MVQIEAELDPPVPTLEDAGAYRFSASRQIYSRQLLHKANKWFEVMDLVHGANVIFKVKPALQVGPCSINWTSDLPCKPRRHWILGIFHAINPNLKTVKLRSGW